MLGRGTGGGGCGRSRGRWAVALACSVAAAVVLAGAGAGGLTPPVAAEVGIAPSTAESTTFQNNALHDGFSVDPEFSAPLRLAWSSTLSGSVGYPLIADGRVFVMLSRPDDGGNHVQAFSLATGEVLWGPVSVGGGWYQQGTIAYDRGRVFAINFHGQLTALNAATGSFVWRTVMEGQHAFTSARPRRTARCTSPAVARRRPCTR